MDYRLTAIRPRYWAAAYDYLGSTREGIPCGVIPTRLLRWSMNVGMNRRSSSPVDGLPLAMLHPSQFEINEAWLAFKLNETPIRTEMEVDFDCIALMDAASGFILGNAFAPAGEAEPSMMEVRRLLEEARAHKQELPQMLFIPSGQFDRILAAEAERQGIAVVRVPEDQLLVFIREARASFKEHFGGGGVQ